MELFGSDRDRLAFLVEIDAALDLDFEALEVQALEEPAQLHQLEAEAGRLDLEAHTRVGCRRPIRFLRLGGRGNMYENKGIPVVANDRLRYCQYQPGNKGDQLKLPPCSSSVSSLVSSSL